MVLLAVPVCLSVVSKLCLRKCLALLYSDVAGFVYSIDSLHNLLKVFYAIVLMRAYLNKLMSKYSLVAISQMLLNLIFVASLPYTSVTLQQILIL